MTDSKKWSVRIADMVLARWPHLKPEWSHEYAVVLKGFEDLWRVTGDKRYFDYIKTTIDDVLDADGKIHGYALEHYSLDHMNSGRQLFVLSEQTKDKRYEKAADMLREQYRSHPRNAKGGFWHKASLADQMYMDGIYMGSVFYAEYAARHNDNAAFDDIAKQILILAEHARDEKTGLYYHVWDEKKVQSWANPQTGCSKSLWARSMGWFSMGLVDILEVMPKNHAKYNEVLKVTQDFLAAVVKVQDAGSGLWWQVLDQGNREGNYLESSASCMFTYSLAKAVNNGLIDAASFRPHVEKAFAGMQKQFIGEDEVGITVKDTCKSAGLGGPAHRDGTFEYYISEARVANDFKGVGSFLLASIQVEKMQ